ncbi:hypothetical protein D9M73_268340 [compost metagenome]
MHLIQSFNRFAAVAANDHDCALLLQRAGEGENVAHIIIHQQHLASFEDPVATAGDLEHLLPVMGQPRFDFVQKKCHLVQQALG